MSDTAVPARVVIPQENACVFPLRREFVCSNPSSPFYGKKLGDMVELSPKNRPQIDGKELARRVLAARAEATAPKQE
jgi:hypothetical protein